MCVVVHSSSSYRSDTDPPASGLTSGRGRKGKEASVDDAIQDFILSTLLYKLSTQRTNDTTYVTLTKLYTQLAGYSGTSLPTHPTH